MKKYTILSLLCAAFCMTALVNIAEAQLFSRFNSCATCAPCEAQPVCCDPQEPAPNEAYCDAYKILICTTGFGKHCSMREQWEALKCEYVFDP
ncbi:MAG: hypothetical protein LBI05_05710, partial [Planctomycetaceae bacterium]|nr:hypothetical protein [Planctomycetaceae bacterium]